MTETTIAGNTKYDIRCKIYNQNLQMVLTET